VKSTITFGLIALVLLAGCTLPVDQPTKQERPARLQLNNSVNTTITFEVSTVQRPAEYTVRFHDGRSDTTTITEGVGVYDPGVNEVFKAVELPESAHLHGEYTLNPNESARTEIDEQHLPVNFAVVVIAYRSENQIISYMTANCDDQALAGLRVVQASHGMSVTHSCV